MTARGARRRGWWQPADLAFGVVCAGWVVYLLSITGDFYFGTDDLRLIEQGSEPGGFLKPYNGHLSVIILAAYRGMVEVGGLAYGPLAVLGVVCLAAVPVGFFVTTRRALGPALAAILAMPLLWGAVSLRPSSLNHHLALLGAVACAAALDRGPRADRLLALALTFSLASAGGGLVVAGACALHSLLTRASRDRWLAVVGPTAIWGAWWWFLADGDPVKPPQPLSGAARIDAIRDLFLAPFENIALGHGWVAAVLVAAFLLYGVRLCLQGIDRAASFLAWTAAMVLWAVAVVQSRGTLADASVARYTYPMLGYALLALVPRQPITSGARLQVLQARRWAWPAAVVVLAVGGVRAADASGGLRAAAQRQANAARDARGTVLVVDQAPGALGADVPLRFYGSFDRGTVADLRRLIQRYGLPRSTTGTVERQLIDVDVVRVERVGRRVRPCEVSGEEIRLEPGRARLWSADGGLVEVRRYGAGWTGLASPGPGEVIAVVLPALHSTADWEARGEGLCLVQPEL